MRFNRMAVLVLVAVVTVAQGAGAASGWAAGLMFGGSRFDLDELDELLVARGFNHLESEDFAAGFGFYRLVHDRIIIGVETLNAEQIVFNGQTKATANVNYAGLDIGYVVLDSNNLRVFPLLGIGRGGVSLQMLERSATPTFDELLAQPLRESESSSGGLLLQFAVGADYFLKLSRQPHRRGGILLGVRAGVSYKPAESSWERERGDVLGGPDVDPSGAFVRFIIGGGRIGTAQ